MSAPDTSVLTQITTDPCKMCMPLGAVSSAYGIRGCLSILHGSQGCSTYIRRHMATHYNEPVDVASSSLTEEGAVFGGEKNLVKGLDNLIKLYEPEAVVVATTCLAETIGEDVRSILRRYKEERPDLKAEVVAVTSPGYGGTRLEGWMATLRALADQIPMEEARHDGINIIAPPLSPADARAVKELLDATGLEYVFLPDISENLDGPYRERYLRLPSGGAPLSDIKRMAGARLTIELGEFCPEKLSPGELLRTRYGVRLSRLPAPMGLKGTDAFISALKDAGGKIPESARSERGRYLDAIIDSHKYASNGRAAIFGDPDLACGIARLCAESGLPPVVAATGGKNPKFAELAKAALESASGWALAGKTKTLDQADFAAIEAAAAETSANILIGGSDGRRLAEKRGLPLIRCGFPVHDRVGGQRIRTMLYQGSLSILDRAVNELQAQTERSWRGALRRDLYEPLAAILPESADPAFARPNAPGASEGGQAAFGGEGRERPQMPGPDRGLSNQADSSQALSSQAASGPMASGEMASGQEASNREVFGQAAPSRPVLGGAVSGVSNTLGFSRQASSNQAPSDRALSNQIGSSLDFQEPRSPNLESPDSGLLRSAPRRLEHPCFSGSAAQANARIHLPVAPACNVSCRYCSREFDCPSESRPGVASRVLSPVEALERFRQVRGMVDSLAVAGIAGPGEALANIGSVMETLRLVRREDPEVLLCLSTNGLELPRFVRDLSEAGVSHLTVTVNAVDPDVGAAIYARIGNPDGIETGPAAAALLLANQLAGIAMAAKMKIAVKVNTVLVDGINNAEAPKVAKMAASLGARMGNVMRHIPVPRSEFGNLIPASEKIWSDVARECERHLPQMRHCRQCRADAAGLLGQDLPLGDSPLRGSPLRQSPSRDLPSEDFPSQSCALRTSLDFTKLADGPRPMSAESPDPADSAGPAPRGAGFPPLPALFPPDLPEQPSMGYNRSEIDSKGIEAKEIESKEIESKKIESKKIEAKEIEAKEIESKKIESKESKARDGELRERAANASMASQSAENAPNVIAEDAVASGEAADSEPSGHELAGNAGEIGQLLDSGVRVAVVSRGGLVLDQHFGQAERLLVYVSDGFQSRLSEIRHLAKGGACGRCGRNDTIGGPPKARPEGLILKLIEACSDCDAVLAMRVGESPRAKLEALGVACFASCGGVGEAVLAVARRLSERGREGVSAAGLIAAG